MLVTLLGIVTEVKLLHHLKAHSPMLVTLLPIVTEVKLRQPSKAKSPMLVTLLGISIDDSLFIPEQHDAGMVSTSFPKTKESTCESKPPELLQFLAFHTTEVKLLQPEKASSPMLVTLLPIVTEVKLLQLRKAELPMLVTLLGIIPESIISNACDAVGDGYRG